MQKRLAEYPDWQKAARYIASKPPCEVSDLVWQPFPDLKNPLHVQIWNALLKEGDVGDGFGRICNYYGLYLVTISGSGGGVQSFSSYFYDPKNHFVLNGNEGMAFSFYRGNREATLTNAIALVQHVLAVDGFQAFVVSNATDIPHTEFTKDNPGLSFKNWLLSKGITIMLPTFIKKNEHTDMNGFSEYNVFVYMPVGGQLFRYEVRCREGYISESVRYLIGSNIGDAWYLM
jgi:hypothetical protein